MQVHTKEQMERRANEKDKLAIDNMRKRYNKTGKKIYLEMAQSRFGVNLDYSSYDNGEERK